MKPIRYLIVCLLCSIAPALYAAEAQDSINRAIYDRVSREVSAYSDSTLPSTMMAIARRMIGTPYVAGTLEQQPETLRVYLDKTDCILFVELCTAWAYTLHGYALPDRHKAAATYDQLCCNIRYLRYRNGQVNGYTSRIHYTSEWIQQAQSSGLMHEITQEQGEEIEQTFSWMTTHSTRYAALKDDTAAQQRIREIEERLTLSGPYYRLTQEQLRTDKVQQWLHEGDIICFIDSHEGLDIAHVALAAKDQGEWHFIHASMRGGKVMLEPTLLSEYAKNGIRVIRVD